MKNRVLAQTFTGLCLAIALAATWTGRHAADEAKTSRMALAFRSAGVDRQLQSADRRIAAADEDRTRLQLELAGLQKQQAAARAVAMRLQFPAILTGNPELFRLWLSAFRARVAGRFRLFYRDLGLAPPQIEKFEDIWAENQAKVIELRAAALGLGMDASDPAIAALQQTEDARLKAEQSALLGDAAYKQLQEFIRQGGVQPMVDAVAFAVAMTPTPLTGDQARELAGILASAESQFQDGGVAVSDVTKVDWNVALGRAQEVLSANQLEALGQEAAQARLRQLLAQFEPGGRR